MEARLIAVTPEPLQGSQSILGHATVSSGSRSPFGNRRKGRGTSPLPPHGMHGAIWREAVILVLSAAV